LLDDLCVLASASPNNLGSANSNVHVSWNQLSDRLYTSLYKPASALTHEFNFNAEFAEWACGHRYVGTRPQIHGHFPPPIAISYIICFVGANTRSRRWPVRRWIEFIKLYRQYSSSNIFLAGNSNAELEMVLAIQQRTDVESIAGTLALSELLNWIAGAQAVITNDTMASHMSVSLNRPTVIIANGVNYMRFSEYRNAGVDRVVTIYPEIVNRHRKRLGDGPYAYSQTVTSDIASIPAATVLKELISLLGDKDSPRTP
jgi:ADP-heptose:LPS heptosyltransferase